MVRKEGKEIVAGSDRPTNVLGYSSGVWDCVGLQDGRSGIQFPAGETYFALLQTNQNGCNTHTACYSMANGFPRG
jgi:hypothetical protein